MKRHARLVLFLIADQLAHLRCPFQFEHKSEAEYQAERDALQARRAALAPPKLPDLEWAAQILGSRSLVWRAPAAS